jgi:hypothetical protein
MAKKNIPPLIIEELQDRANHLYLTLIEYKKEKYLTIIDNIQGSEITAFVLDYAEAEEVDVNWLLSVANLWYYKSSNRYPLSFEMARIGAKNKVTPIMKTFNLDYVSRIIGKIFLYDTDAKPRVKRKRVAVIPTSVEIKLKKSNVMVNSGDFVNIEAKP